MNLSNRWTTSNLLKKLRKIYIESIWGCWSCKIHWFASSWENCSALKMIVSCFSINKSNSFPLGTALNQPKWATLGFSGGYLILNLRHTVQWTLTFIKILNTITLHHCFKLSWRLCVVTWSFFSFYYFTYQPVLWIFFFIFFIIFEMGK